MPSPTEITVAQLVPPRRPARRARQSSTFALEEDFAADPRLIPASVRRPWNEVATVGQGVRRSADRRRMPEGPEAQPGRRRLAAARGRPGGNARRRLRRLARGRSAVSSTSEPMPPRDAAGPHRLGDPRPAEDRPHRLPMADPPLHRSDGACSCSSRPSEVPAVAERFGATPFDIEGVFWSHRGDTCTFDTMIEEFGLASEPLQPARHDRARRRHRPASISRRRRPDCSPPRSACRACSRTTSPSSMRRWRSTTPSIAGAATPPRRRTTGRLTTVRGSAR